MSPYLLKSDQGLEDFYKSITKDFYDIKYWSDFKYEDKLVK